MACYKVFSSIGLCGSTFDTFSKVKAIQDYLCMHTVMVQKVTQFIDRKGCGKTLSCLAVEVHLETL